MPLFINTNVSSLYAQQAAQRASDRLDISYQRLSSGLRINSAKDDAAGIQVANNFFVVVVTRKETRNYQHSQ